MIRDHYGDHPLAAPSAERVVPLLLEMTDATSVIDVGCGAGAWTKAFRDGGVPEDALVGVDGETAPPKGFALPDECYRHGDLTRPFTLGRRFDLAVCLEVAEHLPEGSAETLVRSLTDLAGTVAFSAAIPGQGGPGHVNERWPTYWASLFESVGYACVDTLRWKIWDDPDIAFWYRQNLLLFGDPDFFRRTGSTAGHPVDVVHPVLWDTWQQAAPAASARDIPTIFVRSLKRKLG